MIEIIIKSALLLALGGALGWRLAHGRPATSHLVWTTVFLGAMLMPLLAPWIGPRVVIQMPVSESWRRTPVVSALTDPAPHLGQPSSPATPKPISQPLPRETVLWTIWGLGILFVALRYAMGWRSIDAVRKRRSYLVEPGDLPIDHRAIAARIGITQNWELRQSAVPDVATAMTWGVRRPVVLLPHDADGWTPEKLEAVLLHELAHVRRRDFASQLLAEAVCALYWFNPLAWFGARAMREVAESAADDAVLRSGVKASDYAELLLQLAAEIGQRSRVSARIGVSVMSQPKIESRLKSVLSTSARKRGLTSVQAIATVALVTVSVAAMAAMKITGSSTRQDEAQEALKRARNLAMATQIYSVDYDDVLPYPQDTVVAELVLRPYALNLETFRSPTKGGRFEWNLNIGGVRIIDIKSPAETPAWVERIPGSWPVAVGFVDGHAELVPPSAFKKLQEALKKTHKRSVGPLPKNFLPDGVGMG